MKTKTWYVGYNHPTKTWSSGGTRADYEAPHWDLFLVEAKYSDEAEKAGRALRRVHQSLTQRQRDLLASLRATTPTIEDARKDYVEIATDELATALQLERKKLLIIAPNAERMVQLTLPAFNPSLVRNA